MTEVKKKLCKQVALGIVFLALACPAGAADIKGFQGALFGANEKEVIDAAVKDLSIKAGEIEKSKDDLTKVTILTAKVKNFMPLGLPATINYVLGYKCNCLTRIVIQWDFPDSATAEQRKSAMQGVGALIGRLQEKGWGNDEVVRNRMLGDNHEGADGAVVFFRGQDKQNQAVTLAGAPVKMEKNPKAAKEAKDEGLTANIDKIKTVSLIYEKDATTPDVYRVDLSGF